jgi:hypothetical protein
MLPDKINQTGICSSSKSCSRLNYFDFDIAHVREDTRSVLVRKTTLSPSLYLCFFCQWCKPILVCTSCSICGRCRIDLFLLACHCLQFQSLDKTQRLSLLLLMVNFIEASLQFQSLDKTPRLSLLLLMVNVINASLLRCSVYFLLVFVFCLSSWIRMESSMFETIPQNFRKVNINLLLFINKFPVVIHVKNRYQCMFVGNINLLLFIKGLWRSFCCAYWGQK